MGIENTKKHQMRIKERTYRDLDCLKKQMPGETISDLIDRAVIYFKALYDASLNGEDVYRQDQDGLKHWMIMFEPKEWRKVLREIENGDE